MPVSGKAWVLKFPTSTSVMDLAHPFRNNVTRFIDSLMAGGASVRLSATLRPPERAYLMHFSWRIFRENMDAKHVPAMPGVDIEWVHPTPAATRLAAGEMVRGYGTVFRPSLSSRHTEGRAIDMSVKQWIGKTFVDGTSRSMIVSNEASLHELGSTFGVVKLISDPPHWSDDGR